MPAPRKKKPWKGARDGLQLPLWEAKSDWRPPRVADLPSWAQAKRVGYDLETKDPNLKSLGPGTRRRDGFIAGFSFAIEDGPRYYVPLRHLGGDNVEDPEAALRYLRDQARDFRGELVGANMQYDLDWSATDGVEFTAVKFLRDVQIADPLISELEDSYSLQAIAERHGLPGKDQVLLEEAARQHDVDPKHGLWQLPARFVGPYAEQDGVLPLQILRRQERIIDEQELWDVFNLESRLLPVLVRMRQRGVRVDEAKLEHVEEWSLRQEHEALAKVQHLTGVRIAVGSVWQANALAPALEHIGLVLRRTTHGNPQIDKGLLDSVDHPVAKAIAWARKVNKLRTTFAASIRTHLVNGRIHCTFNQLRTTREESDTERGAAYGRLSSENPNMQQQPARDEFSKMWRSIYIPEDGRKWAANDYSQQEPRMLVHFAELTGHPGAAEAAQQYRENPKLDNHDMMTRMIHGDDVVGAWEKSFWKKQRDYCKTIFLGKCYGMGGLKMCRRIGLPTRWAVTPPREGELRWTPWEYFSDAADASQRAIERGAGFTIREVAGEEGQAIMDKFDAQLPFVKALARQCEAVAKRRGYIKTLSGRRCRFPQLPDGSYDWTHKALNRLIQGSSADQTKKAMVEIDAAGHFLQLQVHDEVDGSVRDDSEAAEIARIMRDTYPLNVPFRVDTEIGPSWGEAK